MTRSPVTTPAAADNGERPPKTLEVQKNFKVLQLHGLRTTHLRTEWPKYQRLQQQVTRLHEAFRSQESRWAAAQRQLQSQIDALARQNQELRDGLKALGPLRLGAREADSAALGTRRKPDALVSQSAFGKTLPLSTDEEILVKHAGRRSRSATVIGQGQSSKHLPSSQATRRSSGRLQEPSSLNPPEPAAGVVRLKEDRPAAEENGMRSQPCMGPEGRLLNPEQTDGSAHSLLGTAKPQNPPVDPGPSHMDPEIKQGDKEEETRSPAGEVAQALGDGREAITFSKGTGKDRGAGKKTTILRFLNGDMKKILPDQRVVYYYADAQIMRTTYPSGLDIVRFPDKQTEKYHPDGSKEIVFPDGTVKRLSDGCEETVFPDGTVVRVERNGDRTIVFSNGQKEIQTAGFERREYPDGTVKTVYCTGYRERRSASGAVKIRIIPKCVPTTHFPVSLPGA
uniref:Centromere protein J-like n=1 Tax=Callorhinus ursinus TaxID=34884 RepID=A0A3Q7Q1X0_CALUR|nr:centromere protein J-like [Callorhinus ursinus]